MKLIAKVTVKNSMKTDKDGKSTGEAISVAPGDSFEIDDESAQILIAGGSAATPDDYDRQLRASKSAEERIAELEAEKAEAEQALADAKAANEKLVADLEAATKAKK